ncbi:MAG: hypoxanthine phosphoribosyltransferase [Syntrophobacterales bacterium]|jgi:hypoxanthine phosphoribosyltransferase|nr:hypoxanthine phosphoribosyltransferase [Syntrophobacterales bacterium]
MKHAIDHMGKKILFSRDVIDRQVKALALRISEDYREQDLIVIGVLKGAFVFMADLIRSMTIPCQIDFVRLTSYGSASTSRGEVTLTKDIEIPVEGRDVLVVEDIIDTGITLAYFVESLKRRNPRSIKVCVFLDKRSRRKTAFEADYVGFTIDDGFVVGYGLDFDEQARFLPDVYLIET